MKPDYRVIIIGSGPSGLATAIELKRLGVDSVLVLERESQAGGIPRHCGHSPYGMREFRRILSGPAYARRLLQQATDLGVEIRLNSTVVELAANARLTLSSSEGVGTLQAEKIVICTGNRETPRSARLISGTRPLGIVTTGALQSMVYLKGRRPFLRPVIVGSELIAFSALLSCRHAGIRPVAMVESANRISAWRPATLMPPLLGCKLLLNHSVLQIDGEQRVESILIRKQKEEPFSLDCDGIIFTGNFVAETSLVRNSHLLLDERGLVPEVDQFGRCSDPDYFSCGNHLHPVDTAGWCWAEGIRCAGFIAMALGDALPDPGNDIHITSSSALLKYFTPQRLSLSTRHIDSLFPGLQIRFLENSSGLLRLSQNQLSLSQRKLRAMRERRILLPLPDSEQLTPGAPLTLDFLPH